MNIPSVEFEVSGSNEYRDNYEQHQYYDQYQDDQYYDETYPDEYLDPTGNPLCYEIDESNCDENGVYYFTDAEWEYSHEDPDHNSAHPDTEKNNRDSRLRPRLRNTSYDSIYSSGSDQNRARFYSIDSDSENPRGRADSIEDATRLRNFSMDSIEGATIRQIKRVDNYQPMPEARPTHFPRMQATFEISTEISLPVNSVDRNTTMHTPSLTATLATQEVVLLSSNKYPSFVLAESYNEEDNEENDDVVGELIDLKGRKGLLAVGSAEQSTTNSDYHVASTHDVQSPITIDNDLHLKSIRRDGGFLTDNKGDIGKSTAIAMNAASSANKSIVNHAPAQTANQRSKVRDVQQSTNALQSDKAKGSISKPTAPSATTEKVIHTTPANSSSKLRESQQAASMKQPQVSIKQPQVTVTPTHPANATAAPLVAASTNHSSIVKPPDHQKFKSTKATASSSPAAPGDQMSQTVSARPRGTSDKPSMKGTRQSPPMGDSPTQMPSSNSSSNSNSKSTRGDQSTSAASLDKSSAVIQAPSFQSQKQPQKLPPKNSSKEPHKDLSKQSAPQRSPNNEETGVKNKSKASNPAAAALSTSQKPKKVSVAIEKAGADANEPSTPSTIPSSPTFLGADETSAASAATSSTPSKGPIPAKAYAAGEVESSAAAAAAAPKVDRIKPAEVTPAAAAAAAAAAADSMSSSPKASTSAGKSRKARGGKGAAPFNESAAAVVAAAEEASGSREKPSAVAGDAFEEQHKHSKQKQVSKLQSTSFLNAVAFGPTDGPSPTLYVASADSAVHCYDGDSAQEKEKLRQHKDRVLCIALSYNSTHSMQGDWRPAAGLRHLIVTGGRDENMAVWDLETYEPVTIIHAHRGPVWAVAVLVRKEFSRTVSGGDDGNIKIWDPFSGSRLHIIKAHKGKLSCLCLLEAQAAAVSLVKVASGGVDKHIHFWSLDTGTKVLSIEGHEDEVTCLATGLFKVAGEATEAAAEAEGKKKRQKDLYSKKTLLMSGSRDRSVRVWLDDKTPLFVFYHSYAVNCVCMAAVFLDGEGRVTRSRKPVVLTGNDNGSLIVWSCDNGKEIKELKVHEMSVQGVAACLLAGDDNARLTPNREGDNGQDTNHDNSAMLIATCSWDKVAVVQSLDAAITKQDVACDCSIS